MAAAAVVVPGLAAPPALAAACADGHGVTVVVEHRELGGGTDLSCGAAGDVAAQQFEDAGHPLTYASRQPGFVCRVDDVPATDPCVNTSPQDAYWGLWWSDGTSGTWTYSSLGADSLTVPDGGYVDFVWHRGSGTTAPAVAATAHPSATADPSATPTPTPTPSPSPTRTPHPTRTPTPTVSASGTPTPPSVSATPVSATPTVSAPVSAPPTRSSAVAPPSTTTSAPPVATASASAQPPGEVDQSSTTQMHTLPAWVVGVVILLIFGAALALALRRGRRRP